MLTYNIIIEKYYLKYKLFYFYFYFYNFIIKKDIIAIIGLFLYIIIY